MQCLGFVFLEKNMQSLFMLDILMCLNKINISRKWLIFNEKTEWQNHFGLVRTIVRVKLVFNSLACKANAIFCTMIKDLYFSLIYCDYQQFRPDHWKLKFL